MPNTAGVLGTAIVELALGMLMACGGRRCGLVLGDALGTAGALLGVTAVATGWLPLLVAGMALLAFGNGGVQLSRYAAADLCPTRRGLALGVVVWAGTVGAVAGPELIALAAGAMQSYRLPPLAGPYALAALATITAVLGTAAIPRGREVPTGSAEEWRPLLSAARPAVCLALLVMVSAQFDMVAVMTLTPLYMDLQGQGLAAIGALLSTHMVGMFALGPLSGWLVDRCGGVMVIMAAWGSLVAASALTVAASISPGPLLPLALFLLGYGWNLSFVGGSDLLSRNLPQAHRTSTQGIIDSVVWASSALATLVSGGLFAAGGYAVLAIAAGIVGGLPLVPIALMFGLRGTRPRRTVLAPEGKETAP